MGGVLATPPWLRCPQQRVYWTRSLGAWESVIKCWFPAGVWSSLGVGSCGLQLPSWDSA